MPCGRIKQLAYFVPFDLPTSPPGLRQGAVVVRLALSPLQTLRHPLPSYLLRPPPFFPFPGHPGHANINTHPNSPKAADVYAFGMLLWAMYTRKTPFEDLQVNQSIQDITVRSISMPLNKLITLVTLITLTLKIE